MKSEKASKRTPAVQEKNRRDRRETIMAAAAKLFADNGYQATTMDQLSAVTGLNKGTVYYYYKSKSDILFDICVVVSERTIKLLMPTLKMALASDGLAHAIAVVVPSIADHRDFVTVNFQESPHFKAIFTKEQNDRIRDQQKITTKVFYELLRRGIESGEFVDQDVTITGRLIVGMLMWIYRWPEPTIESDLVIETLTNIITKGLRPPRAVATPVVKESIDALE